MKFDFCIGNPPYQDDNPGESNTALPVYHNFMDSAFEVSNAVELITPARFLFNAGRTPKEWNEKMLNDEHFKVLDYTSNARLVFSNTDIKGGVAITYHDKFKKYETIKFFIENFELKFLFKKVGCSNDNFHSLSELVFVATKFNLEALSKDYVQYKNRERRCSSNVLVMDCFFKRRKKSSDIEIFGVIKNKRTSRFIDCKYIDKENLLGYKVLLPKADGNGSFGETLTKPMIVGFNCGYTHTFYSIGRFDKEEYASNVVKYVKTKFVRCMLSFAKVTQNINADTWRFVPLQDFTNQSDIDWSKSVHEIDLQLYRKYGLDKKEIAFIEEKVKAMD